jgi:dTDP-4-amino-4,6-dideoxygalactose transaminase
MKTHEDGAAMSTGVDGRRGASVQPVAEADDRPGAGGGHDPIEFAVPDIDEADVDAVAAVLRSRWLTTGAECAALERELADFLDAAHVIGVASCTAALELAFAYLDLPPGSRVGVPVWTFVASALAPMRHGAVPVLLDVDPDTLNLSTESLDAALDEGLDALVAVHFAGNPVDEAVHAHCAEAGVPVVEDAAHAFGASDHRGVLAGQGSVGAAFSFYATKNLSSGEGGALVTDDAELAEFARAHRLHGLVRRAPTRSDPGAELAPVLVGPGIKANLPDLLATLARSQLARFDAMQVDRRRVVDGYRSALGAVPGLQLVPDQAVPGSADHLFAVLLPPGASRAAVMDELRLAGIATSVHFQPLHHFDWMAANAKLGPTGAPVADAAASRALSLPLHPGLSDADVARVCEALVDALPG